MNVDMDQMGSVVEPTDTCGLAPESGFCSSPSLAPVGRPGLTQPDPSPLLPTAFTVQCSRERPKRSTARQPTEFSGQKHFSSLPACAPALSFLDEGSETTLETSQALS